MKWLIHANSQSPEEEKESVELASHDCLDGEWYRIWFNKFLPDPSVQIARGALQTLIEYGYNEVANNVTIIDL